MPLVRKPRLDHVPVYVPLQSDRADERFAAARQRTASPEAVDALASQLEIEADPQVREAILSSLARINTVESFAAALRGLRADDAMLRTASLDALKLMPEQVGLELETLLHDPDADIRVLACDLARAAAPEQAGKILAAILPAEPNVNVCAAAIDLLAEIGTVAMLAAIADCAARFSAPFLDFSVQTAKAEINARSARISG